MLLVVGMVAAPGRAQTTRNVTVRDFLFDPSPLTADPGDPIVWTWAPDSFTHTVTAHQGDTFDSGPRSTGTFSATYVGGTVRYRCTIHSFLNAAGACSGMCGVIVQPDFIPPPPPAITEPTDGAALSTSQVTVAGTASADTVTVRLKEGGAGLQEIPVSGGSWSTVQGFAAGSHTILATALDAAGNESGPSNQVSFTVTDTIPPPAPSITQPPDGSWFRGTSVTVAGRAFGDTVKVRLKETGSVLDEIPVLGGNWSTTRSFSSGRHSILATALDGAGNESGPSNQVIFTVDTTPPAATMTAPSDYQVLLSPVRFEGTGTDDFLVSGVLVTIWNRLRNTRETIPASCTGCGSPAATWSLVRNLPLSVYSAWVTVVDAAGNEASTAPVTFAAL